MSIKNSAPLSDGDYDRLSFIGEMYQSGQILIDQLLNKEFRDNLSVKDCENLIDVAIDNMSNANFVLATFYLYIKDLTLFKNFTIYPSMRKIIKEGIIND